MQNKKDLVIGFTLSVLLMAFFVKFFVIPMGNGNMYKEAGKTLVERSDLLNNRLQ